MKGESRSAVSQEANSAALTVRVAWIWRRSRRRRGSQRMTSSVAASFCLSPPPGDRDRDQRQLGGEQGRRQQGQQRSPGRRGSGRPSGCAPASATSARGRRTRSRGRPPRRARSRARRRAGAAAARGRRPRGRGRSARGSRRAPPRCGAGSPGRRRRGLSPRRRSGASAIGRPWPPAQTIPVKWTGLPAELIRVPPPSATSACQADQPRLLRPRGGGSPRRSRAAAPRRG